MRTLLTYRTDNVTVIRANRTYIAVVGFTLFTISGDLTAQTVRSADSSLPHLCLSLTDQVGLPTGLTITEAAPESMGRPIAYSEVPSSLIILGDTGPHAALPGLRPIGLRTVPPSNKVEFLDQNRREIVQVWDGRVQGSFRLEIDHDLTMVTGTWHDDRWHVLTQGEDEAWSLQSYTSEGTLLATRSLPLSNAGHLRIGAVNSSVIVIEFDVPHRILVIDQDYQGEWNRLSDFAFRGAASGRTVALAPLAVEDLVLATLVDQGPTARTIRLIHLPTDDYRDSRLEVPMAFVSVDPAGHLYAIRETGSRDLLRFSWSISARQCVPVSPPAAHLSRR